MSPSAADNPLAAGECLERLIGTFYCCRGFRLQRNAMEVVMGFGLLALFWHH
jgi:hypothetical protein